MYRVLRLHQEARGSAHRRQRREVYQGRRAYVWDNTGDTATLRSDHRRVVDTESDDTGAMEVYLHLGPTAVRLPPVLDQLVAQQLRQGRLPHTGAAIVTGPWLFPGVKAGQPLSHARAVVRLRRLGLHPGPGRSRALLHLVARLEAPLLAQVLGITPSTAVRWSDLAGRTYSGYVARVVQGKTVEGPDPQERRNGHLFELLGS
ncbi:hypothetical protein [Streptomyces sioyaensis]|uniref:hypothetical protein n=1 Tax=Streptomyces sioyaensis TaxID=67364 RepID=UPI0036EBD7D3